MSGDSRITIDLSDGTDADIAASEAREIISATLRQLLDDIDDPEVSKSDTNADAIIQLAILGGATLAAVFIPISFLPGQSVGVFSEFGFVLAFTITLSSITALTLASGVDV